MKQEISYLKAGGWWWEGGAVGGYFQGYTLIVECVPFRGGGTFKEIEFVPIREQAEHSFV